MRIVIAHLTRMSGGHICAAGIDLATRAHVRPVFPVRQFDRSSLRANGGLFEIGGVIDMEPAIDIGWPPHVEDRSIDPAKCHYLAPMFERGFWDLLNSLAVDSLTSLFGEDLKTEGGPAYIEFGKGKQSLGFIRLPSTPELTVNSRGKPRLRIIDGETRFSLPVTDIRLYQDDNETVDQQAFAETRSILATCGELLLAVGLTRASKQNPDIAGRHWLQVNGLHFRNRPVLK